jgi:universal stress protein E
METIRRILVVVDPTTAGSPAVVKGFDLANRLRAALTLLLCDPAPSLAPQRYPDDESYTAAVEPARALLLAQLSAMARKVDASGLDVDCRVEVGVPLPEGILRAVRGVAPDLVVKDTHHHSFLRRTLLGHTDWSLIRDCPAPLLLVQERRWALPPRIVAAVDPGHPEDAPAALDHALIDAAERLARGFASPIDLLHCWSPVPLLAASAMGDPIASSTPVPQEVLDMLQKQDDEHLRHLARVHDVPAIRVHRFNGLPVEGLPEFAERAAVDVMAMGAVARHGLERLRIGSTAERVLERMPCDVLIVKQPPKAV